MPLVVERYTVTCAAGLGLEALSRSLADGRSGLSNQDIPGGELETWVGRVDAINDQLLPAQWSALESRNNRLAWMALQQDDFLAGLQKRASKVGPERIGIIIGTSTSSIGRTEEAYRQRDTDGRLAPAYLQNRVHELHSPGHFVAAATGLKGPTLTISTACSSSAKVFASAARWLRQGLVDAVLVGGVDSLCWSTLYGFNSLELISAEPCRPFDQRRNGINIGEAAGFAILTRKDLADEGQHELLGYGESSDAHHMSHPHPEAKGAVMAMQQALHSAACEAAEIDYINLHGTATSLNDEIESMALAKLLTKHTLASSTKGWTGHTLGAAGILEAIIALETIRTGLIPGTLNLEQPDENLHFPILQQNVKRPVKRAMSNSFGFGGNNASLVFGARCD